MKFLGILTHYFLQSKPPFLNYSLYLFCAASKHESFCLAFLHIAVYPQYSESTLATSPIVSFFPSVFLFLPSSFLSLPSLPSLPSFHSFHSFHFFLPSFLSSFLFFFFLRVVSGSFSMGVSVFAQNLV